MAERVTIKDIARAAGVADSTVSRALCGHAAISAATRERVRQLADELGYRANALARGLVTRRTTTIGLIVLDVTNSLHAEIVKGVEDTAKARGYAVILCNSFYDIERERSYLQLLQEQRIAGLIVTPVDAGAPHIAALLHEAVPCVLLDAEAPSGLHRVSVDDAAGAQIAVEHLVGLGHRRIGLINGPPHVSAARARAQGYRRALAAAGVPQDAALVRVADLQTGGGAAAARALLELAEPPTALFAANDMMAIGAYVALREAGAEVPRAMSLIGCDDIPMAGLLGPGLTTVAQPKHEMGRLAMDLLLRCLAAPARDGAEPVTGSQLVYRISLEPQLVVRGSTAPPARLVLRSAAGHRAPVAAVARRAVQ